MSEDDAFDVEAGVVKGVDLGNSALVVTGRRRSKSRAMGHR